MTGPHPAPLRGVMGLDRTRLELIPPWADEDEFVVCGGRTPSAGAREWALDGGYLLARGIATCAHGMYLLRSCPAPRGHCRSRFPQLDHPDIWVPRTQDEDGGAPFLLVHSYDKEVKDETRAYARAHGLTLDTLRSGHGDNWYASGMLAIRMTVNSRSAPWPIEQEVAILLAVFPIHEWPERLDGAA